MPWGRRYEEQSFAGHRGRWRGGPTLRAHRVSVCWRWRIELCRILRTGLGLGTGLSVKVVSMTSTEQEIRKLMNDASQREDWDELGRLTGLLLADRPVPTPQQAADEQAANKARLRREAWLFRTGQGDKARAELAQLQRAIPLYGNAAALHLQRQSGGPACRDVAARIRVRAVRPVTRRRGAGAPSRRRTSSASSGGSSDGSGEPAPGEKPPADVDVFVVVGEDHRQVALRLALVLALERGEILLSADPEVRDLVAEALPVALRLIRGGRRGQAAAAGPSVFGEGWTVVIGEVAP